VSTVSAASDLLLNWNDMDRDERLAALDAVVNDTLSENGYAEVDVEGGDAHSNYAVTETGEEGTTITFDEERTLESDDAVEALDTAYHEAGHAMRDQDGGRELLTKDETDTFNEREYVGSYDDEGELHLESTLSPFHDDVVQYGAYMTGQAIDEAAAASGQSVPTAGAPPSPGPASVGGAESAAEANAPSSNELTFEPDFEHAVVTSEPAGDFSFEIDVEHVEISP
jgi:hypothetical protein